MERECVKLNLNLNDVVASGECLDGKEGAGLQSREAKDTHHHNTAVAVEQRPKTKTRAHF